MLPDRRLPADEAGCVTEVTRALGQCRLSIHLVGRSYGVVPDGPNQKSVVILQNELAVERSRQHALQRVIWLPEGTRSTQAHQQAYIEALHQDAELQLGADLVTGALDQVKRVIHATLKKLEASTPETSEDTTDEARSVYLICDARDRKATVPIRKFLRAHRCGVELPAFEGDAAAVRGVNERLLATCDAVLLFYGTGDEAWKRTVDNELKKVPGYRGGKPLLAKLTYLAYPKTTDKEDLLNMEEPNLINGLDGFSETKMAGFMRAVRPPGAKA